MQEGYRENQIKLSKDRWADLEFHTRMCNIHKELWKDEEYRNSQLTKMHSIGRPTYPEKVFTDLVNKENLPIDYTGTGKGVRIIKGSLIPDFTVRNKNKVIEIFGEAWHDYDDEEHRKTLFGELGIDCLVIWAKELKNNKEVIQKVEQFINSS